MDTSELLIVGAVVVGVVLITRSKPSAGQSQAAVQIAVGKPPPPTNGKVNGLAAGVPGDGGLGGFAGLPDPANLPLGTKSPDGQWVVSQSRAYGSVPHWEHVASGLGGIFG